jgi:hypothetical protein
MRIRRGALTSRGPAGLGGHESALRISKGLSMSVEECRAESGTADTTTNHWGMDVCFRVARLVRGRFR